MQIRRLEIKDVESYFQNRLQALQDSPSAFMTTLAEEKERGLEHFKKTLSHEGFEKVIFGAVLDDVVVATLGISKEDRQKNSHRASIWGVFVDPKYRGQGLAAKLLDQAIAFAKQNMNVVVIGLSVESTNHHARKLYESRGFKVWGTEPLAMKANDTYYDEDQMALVLK